ncbi:MAG: hypothetical protein ACE145_18745 [Terriglobia bacterium]
MLAAFYLLLSARCFLPTSCLIAQEQAPATEPPPAAEDEERPLPGDWAVEVIDAADHSPNAEAHDALYRAMMGTGPKIIPQLEEALKDDRTAEFAAQALAFIGGEKAIQILWKLQFDKRDLNLRRFYYAALAEYDAPEATDTLLTAIKTADDEPDRSVTEAAVIALTVRSDPKLVAPLREAQAKIKDVVIRLDLENAADVIERRAQYLAGPPPKKPGGSVEQAVRTYFAPALTGAEPSQAVPPARPAGGSKSPPPKGAGARAAVAKPSASVESPVKVRVEQITFTPDKARALARVAFEDPSAIANYDIVLQKRLGDWYVASVWLGSETEKAPVTPLSPEREQD